MTSPYTAPTSRTVLVTGGSGFVGGHLIAHLREIGWQVRGIGRSAASRAAVAAKGAEPWDADLSDPAALERAMAGVDTVFHVAAHFKLWGPRRLFRAMNVAGTRNVVSAAQRAGVRRVVYVSAAAVVMGRPEPQRAVTEDLPLRRMGFAPYSTSEAEAEKILRAASGRRKGFSTVAIRQHSAGKVCDQVTTVTSDPGKRSDPLGFMRKAARSAAGTAGESRKPWAIRQPMARSNSP